MANETVIKVENVSKKFSKNLRKSLLLGTADLVKDLIGFPPDSTKLRKSEFWALENVSFEIKKGESLGVIGNNGSGKSTLLRLITGIFPPDTGRIEINGRIGALIAVGAGFHPHMTGRENIYLNGVILGMSTDEVNEQFEKIVDFAEIGEFIDAPVSTYSSGMRVRLGFAIAIHASIDILLVDEVLAVGDARFRNKCLDKIAELREADSSFLLVSHNMQNIELVCDKCLFLNNGKVMMYDTPDKVIPEYELLSEYDKDYVQTKVATEQPSKQGLQLVYKHSNWGTDDVTVNSLRVLDAGGKDMHDNISDFGLNIEIDITSRMDIETSYMWLSFIRKSSKARSIDDQTSAAIRQKITIKKGDSKIKLKLPNFVLATGRYNIALHFFDYAFNQTYSQGHYEELTVKYHIPNNTDVGHSTPYVWLDPEITIN